MPGPLVGYKVLDMSRVLAGPWAGQLLADMGAEVIEIERPIVGDDTRHWGPPYLKDEAGNNTEDAAYYFCANRGKQSVTVDITQPDGQQIIRQLAAQADVLIENYKVGGLKKYGLDYMAGHTIGDTVTCQSKATQETLRKKDRMVREFVIDGLNEEDLGGLFVSFMLETVLTAHLMGVNAFDQPAVEEGKILTRSYLAALK